MPKHKTITAAAADRLIAKSGRVDHFDSSHPGLHLRVSATGRKTWLFAYRLVNGKILQRRMTLGDYPELSVAGAHEAWRKARDLVAAGRDPMAVHDELPAQSFTSVYEEWFKRDQAKHRSARRTDLRFRKYVLPAWQGRMITDIDRRACLAVIDDIRDNGTPVLANRVQSHLYRLFKWCIGRGIIEINPLQHAEKTKEETRDRVLSDDELKKVWCASEKMPPAYRDALRLLVLTGCRKEEISKLRREEIHGDVIHLEGERTKNGKPHIVPLSTAARAILANADTSRSLLFVSRGGLSINNWHNEKQRLDAESGVTNWVLHDLRRTVATGLQRQGVPLPVTEAVLGHVSGSRSGIVGVYQRHDYLPEKRAALEAWGAYVVALVEGGQRGKVLAWGR
jgi:integrase